MFNGIARKVQTQVSSALALPSPTGGLNDLDPISNMDPSFMIDCLDVYPDTDMVKCRPGYKIIQPELDGDPVKTILAYSAEDGTVQYFAATDSAIWDINTPGTPTDEYTITNGEMGYLNFTTAAGNYLVAWNGQDPAVFYDGTTWAPFVEVVTPSAPGEISGVDPADIIWMTVHMARLWIITKDAMEAHYLPVDSIGGVATAFFVGASFSKGGSLMAAMRWSSDTGRGLDDRLVFFTTPGEIAVYSGTDPAVAANWRLDSTFYLAPPLGQRGIVAYGGDILILTRRGLVPVSTLAYGTTPETLFAGILSKRINQQLNALTENWQDMPFPVEVFVHSDRTWITITLWDELNLRSIQYVMNTITGAWGKFSYPVRTMHTVDNVTHMGTEDGRVLMVTPKVFMDEVLMDDTGGNPILFYAMGAYNYYGNPNANKHAKLIQVAIRSVVPPSFGVRVLPDFRMEDYYPPIADGAGALGAPIWDSAIWDEATWPTNKNTWLVWRSAPALGYAFAWQFRGSTRVSMGIAATKLVWEPGGLV